jgi:hypothetical protein
VRIVPIFQKAAFDFVEKHHTHHSKPVGSIFQIGCKINDDLVGVAICGRPVASKTDYTSIIEVTRLCVLRGNKNACSKLYSACARIAKEMGYYKIQTFTKISESGHSLIATGWTLEETNIGTGKPHFSKNRVRSYTVNDMFGEKQKSPEEPSNRWSKILNNYSPCQILYTPERVALPLY